MAYWTLHDWHEVAWGDIPSELADFTKQYNALVAALGDCTQWSINRQAAPQVLGGGDAFCVEIKPTAAHTDLRFMYFWSTGVGAGTGYPANGTAIHGGNNGQYQHSVCLSPDANTAGGALNLADVVHADGPWGSGARWTGWSANGYYRDGITDPEKLPIRYACLESEDHLVILFHTIENASISALLLGDIVNPAESNEGPTSSSCYGFCSRGTVYNHIYAYGWRQVNASGGSGIFSGYINASAVQSQIVVCPCWEALPLSSGRVGIACQRSQGYYSEPGYPGMFTDSTGRKYHLDIPINTNGKATDMRYVGTLRRVRVAEDVRARKTVYDDSPVPVQASILISTRISQTADTMAFDEA